MISKNNIGFNEKAVWIKEKADRIKAYISEHNASLPTKVKLENRLFGILVKMEYLLEEEGEKT